MTKHPLIDRSDALRLIALVVYGLIGIALFTLAFVISEPKAQEAGSVDAALVFAADTSGSMKADERAFIRQAHAVAITSPDVLSAIAAGHHKRVAVAYVEWASGRPLTVLDWRLIDGPTAAAAFAAALLADDDRPPHALGHGTRPDLGLREARRLFGLLPWPASKTVVDIVTDSWGENEAQANLQRDALLALGETMTINALIVTVGETFGTMDEIRLWHAANLTGGPGSFIMDAADHDSLAAAVRSKLIQELG